MSMIRRNDSQPAAEHMSALGLPSAQLADEGIGGGCQQFWASPAGTLRQRRMREMRFMARPLPVAICSTVYAGAGQPLDSSWNARGKAKPPAYSEAAQLGERRPSVNPLTATNAVPSRIRDMATGLAGGLHHWIADPAIWMNHERRWPS